MQHQFSSKEEFQQEQIVTSNNRCLAIHRENFRNRNKVINIQVKFKQVKVLTNRLNKSKVVDHQASFRARVMLTPLYLTKLKAMT